jgi:hypothetical protein
MDGTKSLMVAETIRVIQSDTWRMECLETVEAWIEWPSAS